MRFPRVVVCAATEELELDLRPLAQARRWVVAGFRRIDSAIAALVPGSPTVLLLEVDPETPDVDTLRQVLDVGRTFPDVPVVVLSAGKMPEAERPNWVAILLSLGVSYVLFPPVTPTVIEDLISGLLLAKTTLTEARTPADIEAIDLAEEGLLEG